MNNILDKLMLYAFENGSLTWSVNTTSSKNHKCNCNPPLSFQCCDAQLSRLRELNSLSSPLHSSDRKTLCLQWLTNDTHLIFMGLHFVISKRMSIHLV